jgi:LysR family transcriptional activator of nhaA
MHLPDLNYNHLRYFWMVAHEGSIAKACTKLNVSQPTVSEQLRSLAEAIGSELFQRDGRGLRLTPTGRLVLEYADDIFALGHELHEALASRRSSRVLPVTVGIVDSVSKLVAYRLIEPALRLPDAATVTVREDDHDGLIARLADHELDLVLSDTPLESHRRLKAFCRPLGESVQAFFAAPAQAGLRKGFPHSLTGAPLIAPLPHTPQRRALDAWCATQGIRPRIVAQFEDSALMKTVGQAGHGVFLSPDAIADETCRQFDVEMIGRVPQLRESYYAISLDKKLEHPALRAITATARDLFH